jgi:excisionase family DNA binding protein
VLNNPAYAGAYTYGRYTTKRRVQPDGSLKSTITLLPRPQWAVLIHDHHDAFISWADHLSIEAKLATNRTNTGARPPREGVALCQGILACGSCGKPMSTRYHRNGRPAYECKSRLDLDNTPTCRSIATSTVDDAVTARLLAALTPGEVALAFAAADQVEQRRSSTTRAAELAVERARYEADRAERAFHAAEPENRLVTRNLETRWENRLATLAEAETALQTARDAIPPTPDRATLQTLVTDMPRLFNADTTTAKDRKRLLRTLIADVTILPEHDPAHARIGIRWHTGATDEITITRPVHAGTAKRTPAPATEMIIRLGPTTSNTDLVELLNTAGHTTGTGRAFDINAVRWIRHAHKVPVPKPQNDGELSVKQAAARLGISADTVYTWIANTHLEIRRTPTGRICVPWNHQVEAACRERIARSVHLKPATTTPTATAEEAV